MNSKTPIPTLMTALLLWMSGSAEAIPYSDARHLLARSGFDAPPEEIRQWAALEYPQAVDRLLAQAGGSPVTSAPEWVGKLPLTPQQRKQLSKEERKERQRTHRRWGHELKGWWLQEMVATERPFLEHMTLFWHNHFTSSLRKVRWPPLMYNQNQLLRQHALGNFRDLLHAIARDPAMVIYLDNVSNRKGSPNENFARELLELFTLGEGHYTEQDIKEAARAFTGWSLDRNSGKFRFRSRLHDKGVKQFMGVSGRLSGDDVIEIVLRQPRVAEQITEKLWREFVSPDPNPQQVKRLAKIFRESGYEIRPLMRALFLTPEFRRPANRGVLIKSPVELVVGTVRVLKIPLNDSRGVVMATTGMGQDLMDPPNVKGWPGGESWINSSSLLTREWAMQRLLRGDEMGKKQQGTRKTMMASKPMPGMMQSYATLTASEEGQKELLQTLLAIAPVTAPDSGEGREWLEQLLTDPVYQLK
jgi:uncharacterized protein (DUF1800 family)